MGAWWCLVVRPRRQRNAGSPLHRPCSGNAVSAPQHNSEMQQQQRQRQQQRQQLHDRGSGSGDSGAPTWQTMRQVAAWVRVGSFLAPGKNLAST